MIGGRVRSGRRGEVLLRLVLVSGSSCDVAIADGAATIGDVIRAVLSNWPASWAAEADRAAVRGMRILHQGRYLSEAMAVADLQLPRDQYVGMHVVLHMQRGPARRHGSGEFCCEGTVEAGRCRHGGSGSRATITFPASMASLPSLSPAGTRAKGSFSYISRPRSPRSSCGCIPGCCIM